ncbi:MAG TPA: metalloregulator ArsR/SmtB family transcription factor [Chitinophagales bacterium]|nr:metalloregulator ArsR/SmtB family transcription factor [Chitinophagales bacterium]
MKSDKLSIETLDADIIKSNLSIIKTASFITKSVNNSFRQKMMGLLLVNKKMAVKDLSAELQAEQSIVSQHLALLRRAKLVLSERSGKSVLYSANEKNLSQIIYYFAGICNMAK